MELDPLMRRLAAVALLTLALPLSARVVRLDIASRTDVGDRYEKIKGRVVFAVDPANAHNRIIADLDRAPRDARGEVTFTSDVVILRPKCGGNDTLYVEVPNRGGLGSFAEPKYDDALFQRGYTMAWVAWQFDVRDDAELLHFDAPVARGVRGQVRSDFIVDQPMAEHTIGHFISASYGKEPFSALGGKGYPVADRNDPANVLTVREAVTATPRPIPRSQWRFKDDRTIQLDGGFVPGRIYEITYTAVDPAVVGTGLAAIRDFASWARNDPSSIAHAKHAYALGISQTGRFLRHFVYEGFNADEEGRQVFDGLIVFVAGAGRGNFNHRFAQPSRAPLSPVPAFDRADIFPFTDLPATDRATGRTEGLLDRATADKVVPKIFYVNTAYEYWSRGGSLIHTTPDGRTDVAPPPTSRIYFITGTGHVDGPFPPERAAGGQSLQNMVSYWVVAHGLIDAMDAWVKQGTEPPPSRYPKIADGTLVPPAALAMKNAPTWAYAPFRDDRRSTYTTLVPQVNADGNELTGVRLPFLSAPMGTHTGWNLRAPATGFPTDRALFAGAFLPFTKEEVARRYPSRDAYLGAITAATLKLVEERYFARQDVLEILQQALQLWDWAAARP